MKNDYEKKEMDGVRISLSSDKVKKNMFFFPFSNMRLMKDDSKVKVALTTLSPSLSGVWTRRSAARYMPYSSSRDKDEPTPPFMYFQSGSQRRERENKGKGRGREKR